VTDTSESALRRRRDEWVEAGVFSSLVEEAISGYNKIVGLELADLAIDGSQHKAPFGGEATGPSPVDRANGDGSGRSPPMPTASVSPGSLLRRTPTTAPCSLQRSMPWQRADCSWMSTSFTSTGLRLRPRPRRLRRSPSRFGHPEDSTAWQEEREAEQTSCGPRPTLVGRADPIRGCRTSVNSVGTPTASQFTGPPRLTSRSRSSSRSSS